MSSTSPSKTLDQFVVRFPDGMRDRIREAADASGRSMNAEIITRLEESLFRERRPSGILPAEKARALAEQSRKALPAEVFSRVEEGINKGIAMGHSWVMVDLSDLELESMDQAGIDAITQPLEDTLKEAGYRVDWDGLESITIEF